MVRNLVFIAMSFLLSQLSLAGCDKQGCTSKIKRVYVTGHSDGRVFIEPVDKLADIVNCSPAESVFFTLSRSHASFNEIYAMALASNMADKEVRMRVVEGSEGCELLYMWVWAS